MGAFAGFGALALKVMQDPMTESIRLKVRIPFTVCLRIGKVLQRRDNAFVDLATRYNNMDPRELGVESDSLSMLHRMLGEIAAIARASGINTLRGEVNANAAHGAAGNTEGKAAAAKGSGPKWEGRSKGKGEKGDKKEGKDSYTCAAEGCTAELNKQQVDSINAGQFKNPDDHTVLCDHHFDLMGTAKSVTLKPDSKGNARERKSSKTAQTNRKKWKANRVEALLAVRAELASSPGTAPSSAAAVTATNTPAAATSPEVDVDDSASNVGSVMSTVSDFVKVPASGNQPGFVLNTDTGQRFYESAGADSTAAEPSSTLVEHRQQQAAAAARLASSPPSRACPRSLPRE